MTRGILVALMTVPLVLACAAAPQPTSTPTPTAAPTATGSPTAPPTATPSAAPTAAPTASPVPTAAPTPVPTAPPATPPPSIGPDGIATYILDGAAFTAVDVPDGARVRRSGTDVILDSTRDAPGSTKVFWLLDPSALPQGRTIESVDGRICGIGEGDFWEVYGPPGSEPEEYEVTQPEADGCWHFGDAPGDYLEFHAEVEADSTLTITQVVYEIKFAD